MAKVVVAGGINEPVTVDGRDGRDYPGMRCRACGSIFVASDPSKIPSHECSGLVEKGPPGPVRVPGVMKSGSW